MARFSAVLSLLLSAFATWPAAAGFLEFAAPPALPPAPSQGAEAAPQDKMSHAMEVLRAAREHASKSRAARVAARVYSVDYHPETFLQQKPNAYEYKSNDIVATLQAAVSPVAFMHKVEPAADKKAELGQKILARRSAKVLDSKIEDVEKVAKLHAKMEKVASALDGMLSSETQGSLANAAVAPAMRTFLSELHRTLNETEKPANMTVALRRLEAAQAGMSDLTAALTKQQVALAHEGEAEEASLLLGVLLTKRAQPFEQQLAIFQDPEFRSLAVSKDLLAKHDMSTPLFQQVGAWMDKHGGNQAHTSQADKLAKTLSYFQSRVETLEDVERRMQKAHAKALSNFDALEKGTSKKGAQRYEMLKKRSNHQYKKTMAVQHNQLVMMKSVVSALRKGDAGALKKAQDALKASMKAMEAKTGNFLHLLQLGHRLERRDCPYCAAQCIEKCHDAGNPYTACLTQCADAGK